MISIALCTYNGEKYIREQIDSILNQTYSDFELVCIDDCSSDSTFDILTDYANTDARLKIHRNEKNLGFKKNFEKAISLCSGEFIALADQDDIWENWKISESINAIGNRDFVCSNALCVDENNNSLNYTMKEVVKYHYFPKNQFTLFRRLFFENIVQGSTILAKADFLKSCLPIPDNFKFHDYYFAFKACSRNGFGYIDKCTIRYRQHTDNVTENNKKQFSDDIKMNMANPSEWYKAHCEFCKSKAKESLDLLEIKGFNERQISFIKKNARYHLELQNKTFYTFLFFAGNCSAFFLDKNIFRNSLRIIKRLLGFIRWKFLFARKYHVSIEQSF